VVLTSKHAARGVNPGDLGANGRGAGRGPRSTSIGARRDGGIGSSVNGKSRHEGYFKLFETLEENDPEQKPRR